MSGVACTGPTTMQKWSYIILWHMRNSIVLLRSYISVTVAFLAACEGHYELAIRASVDVFHANFQVLAILRVAVVGGLLCLPHVAKVVQLSLCLKKDTNLFSVAL